VLAVTRLIARGRSLSRVLLARAASVTLDWDTRCRSRFAARDSLGRELGVFLPRGSVVRGGDVLVAEDGSLVRVEAAAQPVLVVRAGPAHGDQLDLARAAYHLGNRHVALEVHADRLQLEPDHVLAEMLERMHLLVSEELAPFEPEGGAYGAAAAHAHGGRAHDHGHGHDDGHDHAHGHGD
jgi:urease accessory protein